jgi:hypothetical protein
MRVQVAFKHQVTGVYLHSHDVKYRQPIAGQQEVSGVPAKNANCRWISEARQLRSFPSTSPPQPWLTRPPPPSSSPSPRAQLQEGIYFPEREQVAAAKESQ